MFRWSLALFAAFLIAALFGFGGLVRGTSGLAPALYGLFIGVFIASLIWGFAPIRRMGPPPAA